MTRQVVPSIPEWTLPNLQAAIGDVMRASAAWGQADAKGEDVSAHINCVSEVVAKLLALIMRRDPTADELIACISQ